MVGKYEFRRRSTCTTNGGLNGSLQALAGVYPNKIYMYNSRIGFIGFNAGSPTNKTTTDGGFQPLTVSNEVLLI
ncbi:MAG: hypothetical protein IPM96_22045 [Ignavibacteria bacterium]|nr:hypothetical protein [Ignavibacteria bacterium]